MSKFNPNNSPVTNTSAVHPQSQVRSGVAAAAASASSVPSSRPVPVDKYDISSQAASSAGSSSQERDSVIMDPGSKDQQVLAQKGYNPDPAKINKYCGGGAEVKRLECNFITYSSAKVKDLICIKFESMRDDKREDVIQAKSQLMKCITEAFAGISPRNDVRPEVIGFSIKGEERSIPASHPYLPAESGIVLKFKSVEDRDNIMSITGWDNTQYAKKIDGTAEMLWTLPARNTNGNLLNATGKTNISL